MYLTRMELFLWLFQLSVIFQTILHQKWQQCKTKCTMLVEEKRREPQKKSFLVSKFLSSRIFFRKEVFVFLFYMFSQHHFSPKQHFPPDLFNLHFPSCSFPKQSRNEHKCPVFLCLGFPDPGTLHLCRCLLQDLLGTWGKSIVLAKDFTKRAVSESQVLFLLEHDNTIISGVAFQCSLTASVQQRPLLFFHLKKVLWEGSFIFFDRTTGKIRLQRHVFHCTLEGCQVTWKEIKKTWDTPMTQLNSHFSEVNWWYHWHSVHRSQHNSRLSWVGSISLPQTWVGQEHKFFYMYSQNSLNAPVSMLSPYTNFKVLLYRS